MKVGARGGRPRIVIVGRPNVGKSSLFNRLAGQRLALVGDRPALTRDRKEAEIELAGHRVILADTAGLEESPPATLAGRMTDATTRAVGKADLVLLVIDARAGVIPADEYFAARLRRLKCPVLLVANKTEGRAAWGAMEGFALGFGTPIAVSAEHGDGISVLIEAIVEGLGEAAPEAAEPPLMRIAIIGRPNAGKSTLFNRLVGQERTLTGPEPGLTRDAIAERWRDVEGRVYELIDTAGLRRRSRVASPEEKLGTGAAIAALRRAEVVVLAVDATVGLHEQDLTLAGLVEREGRALVLALTKWDTVVEPKAVLAAIEARISASLAQLKGLPVVALSAKTGEGMDRLMPAIRTTYENWNRRIPTALFNRWLQETLATHSPPVIGGRRLKLRYATQPGTRPPDFVIFGTRAEATPGTYRRYLLNSLRERFDLPGTPVRLMFRSPSNPYRPNG